MFGVKLKDSFYILSASTVTHVFSMENNNNGNNNNVNNNNGNNNNGNNNNGEDKIKKFYDVYRKITINKCKKESIFKRMIGDRFYPFLSYSSKDIKDVIFNKLAAIGNIDRNAANFNEEDCKDRIENLILNIKKSQNNNEENIFNLYLIDSNLENYKILIKATIYAFINNIDVINQEQLVINQEQLDNFNVDLSDIKKSII